MIVAKPLKICASVLRRTVENLAAFVKNDDLVEKIVDAFPGLVAVVT